MVAIPAATGQTGPGDDPFVPTPPQTRVKVATSGDFSERIERLEINRNRSRPGEVLISLAPEQLPSLAAGDRLELSAEVQFTVDCHKQSSRCLGNAYDYNPDIDVQMVLGTGPDDAGGRDAVPVGGSQREDCMQKPPNREHHCVAAFKRTMSQIPADAPCLLEGCYVNLVAVAHNRNARSGEFLAVGGIRPNGSVPQDRARLNVVRYHPAGYLEPERQRITKPANRKLPLTQRRTVVYSVPLPDLVAGEQLAVEATANVDISHLPYNVIVSSQLILTDSPDATDRGLAKEITTGRGEFDEGNGFNCTLNLRFCTIRKVGVMRMKKDAVRAGRPVTLYATLVTNAGPKHLEAKSKDRVRVRGDGGLQVERFGADVRG